FLIIDHLYLSLYIKKYSAPLAITDLILSGLTIIALIACTILDIYYSKGDATEFTCIFLNTSRISLIIERFRGSSRFLLLANFSIFEIRSFDVFTICSF